MDAQGLNDSHFNLAEWYDAHPEARPLPPIQWLADARDHWAATVQPLPQDPSADRDAYPRIYVPTSRGKALSREYDALPEWDDSALESFDAFIDETARQYDFLISLGVDVEVVAWDPYETHHELHADLARKRLKVLDTRVTGNHPYLSPAENNMFRAVHDAFGHGATGRGFDRHGEDAAWFSHSRMFSPRAIPAMTTETRGQNSALNYGGGTGFPQQKVALLPSWATRDIAFASL